MAMKERYYNETPPLTPSERQSIIERDNSTSQMRHYSEERGFYKRTREDCKICTITGKECGLQVHHINPRGNGGGNNPNNLITLFTCEHVGKRADGSLVDYHEEFVVHPDTIDATIDYRAGNKKAYANMAKRRDDIYKSGEPYWNTDHDAEMTETAHENTLIAAAHGWIYKARKKKLK